uniref:hypothetical protein n=1 Tax=Staphylococcus borealis TaxID=2742203 RepID=UPI00374E4E35
MSKFLKDSTLNIISNLLVVIAVQLVAFPVINKRVESEDFALLIVFYGIAIVVATSLGNTLNNVRLLHREGFRDSERESIFSKIFLLLLALNFILYTIICLFYNKEISIDMFFMVMFSILLTARYYLNVYFRENLNYKNILFVNMFVFIGYFFGIGIFVILNKFYSMVFFMGELFGFIFLIKKSGFL